MTERRALIKPPHPQLSVHRQCQLLGLPRSSFYYQPVAPDRLTLELMNAIDRIYTEHPIYGVRRIGATLRRAGYPVNPKRVHRLMKAMGLQAIYPRTRRTTPDPQHRVYPYLLRGVTVDRPDHVWCSDITYLPVGSGFVYLVAVMDWFSRYVLSGRVSNTLDAAFCLEALEEALGQGRPEIFNTDQGAQFTSAAFTGRVEAAGARVSMDGRGRVLDNIFIERPWRSLKYEDVYLKGYDTVPQLIDGVAAYFTLLQPRAAPPGLRLRDAQPCLPPSGLTAQAHLGPRLPAWLQVREAGLRCELRAGGPFPWSSKLSLVPAQFLSS